MDRSFKLFLFAIFTCSVLTHSLASAQQYKQVDKGNIEISAPDNSVAIFPQQKVSFLKCFEKCIRDNQMVAMGIERIKEGCEKECELKQAIRLSQSSRKKEQIQGIKKLCQIQDGRTVPFLIAALRREFSERTGLFAWIIPALGRLKDPKAIPVLVQSLRLRDESWMGREMSVKALGEIGDHSAIPALIEASQYPDTREASIENLAKFDDVQIIPTLLTALEPEEDEKIRETAMISLLRLGKKAIPYLVTAFNDFSSEYPQTQKRLWICKLLGRIKDERAYKRLKQSLNDPDEAVRKCAANFLFSNRDNVSK